MQRDGPGIDRETGIPRRLERSRVFPGARLGESMSGWPLLAGTEEAPPASRRIGALRDIGAKQTQS